jgi:hypothetical protein
VAAPTKAAAPQARRTSTPQPQPAAEEEGVVWERLAPDTVESARANTPPSQTRKRPSSALHRALSPEALVQRQRRRVILVVSIVSAVILGGFAVAAIWAALRDKAPDGASAAPQPRAALRVGQGAEFATVAQAIKAAMPGDRIVVTGEKHEEELMLDGKFSPTLKNLIIESEGRTVAWRAPQGKSPPCLIILRGVEGLRLQGFTLDGDNRCKNIVQIYGICPGTSLDNLTLTGFTDSGMVFWNCEGKDDRPITINRVQVRGNGKGKAAVEFALEPPSRAAKNRFMQFNDFLTDFNSTVVLNPGNHDATVKGLP